MSRGNVELTHVAHDDHAVRYGRLLVGGDPFGYWALRMTVFTAAVQEEIYPCFTWAAPWQAAHKPIKISHQVNTQYRLR